VFLFVGFCLKVRMALCCIRGISGLQKEKQPEWSFCIQGPGKASALCGIDPTGVDNAGIMYSFSSFFYFFFLD